MSAAGDETVRTCSSGAAEFYAQHAQPDFLEACYDSAPARIRAALSDELDYLGHILPGSEVVLEVGCGNGRLLEALGEVVGCWVGVDFLEAYVHHARAHRRLARATGLVVGRAEQLPFADAAFDTVVCAQSTWGILGAHKAHALREARRVSRAGGRLIFVVYAESSVVPRVEWYTEMHRRGMMAALDWARSTPELLLTEDGHASECFRRERLIELFQEAGFEPHIQPVGELYWAVEARRD